MTCYYQKFRTGEVKTAKSLKGLSFHYNVNWTAPDVDLASGLPLAWFEIYFSYHYVFRIQSKLKPLSSGSHHCANLGVILGMYYHISGFKKGIIGPYLLGSRGNVRNVMDAPVLHRS